MRNSIFNQLNILAGKQCLSHDSKNQSSRCRIHDVPVNKSFEIGMRIVAGYIIILLIHNIFMYFRDNRRIKHC